MTTARPDVHDPGRLTELATDLECALARRMHLLAAALTAGGSLPFVFLLLGRTATPGGLAVLGVAVFGISAALVSLWWVRRTQRYVVAIELLCWPVFLALLTLMAAQGGVGGTAVWWLPVAPLIALQGGASRSGVAMAVLMMVALATVHALGLHGDLRLPLLAPSLDNTRRFLVVTNLGPAADLALPARAKEIVLASDEGVRIHGGHAHMPQDSVALLVC